MTRNIASRYQDIHEAVERAYLDAIPSESKGEICIEAAVWSSAYLRKFA